VAHTTFLGYQGMKAHLVRAERSELEDWHTAIREELQEVEERLLEAIGSDVPAVFDLSKHLLSAGGKRLRPALVVLSSKALGSADQTRVTSMAVTVELIHMASLMHDDVVDHSEFRRGRVTTNAFWGNKLSVLGGDCILAKAFSFLARDGDQRIMRVISDMTIRMSESEVLQALCERDVEGWRKHYWRIIRHKTAGFLSACCRCGAILAHASPAAEEALAAYGMELGMAFQLTDDLLDIVGEPGITGKAIGSDLRDGKVTLPVILALDSMTEPERARTRALIEKDDLSSEALEGLCSSIRATEAPEMARDCARTYAERATALLAKLPPSSARDGLGLLASEMIYRIS